MITARNPWTNTPASGFVDALPNDWEEACRWTERRAWACGNGDDDDFVITPNLLVRAYSFLFQAFASDCGALKEIQSLTVSQVIEWYLDF